MKELGEALKAILDKFGVFLDLFDLSFLISGAVSVGALAFGCHQSGCWPKPNEFPPNWLLGVILIVAVYVAGMFCFALGRWIRQTLKPSARESERGAKLFELICHHGLADIEPIKGYLERALRNGGKDAEPTSWALHNRIWASLRHDPALAGSLSILNRYWVMAASYDGLTVALSLWSGVLAWLSCRNGLGCDLGPWIRLGLSLSIGVVGATVCLREAGRYTVHQLGELAATVAAMQKAKWPSLLI